MFLYKCIDQYWIINILMSGLFKSFDKVVSA